MTSNYVSIVMFDLPTLTANDKREYRIFRKKLIALGYYFLQGSVYIKKHYSNEQMKTMLKKVKLLAPIKGDLIVFTLTEKQFEQSFNRILGKEKIFETIMSTSDKIIEI